MPLHISFNFSTCGHRGEVIVHALEKEDIYVSTTSACSSKEQVASRTLKAIRVNDRDSQKVPSELAYHMKIQ